MMRRVSMMKWATYWKAIHVVAPRFVTTAASNPPPFTRSKQASGRSLIYPTAGPNQPVATVEELTAMKGKLMTMEAELATMKDVAYQIGSVPKGYETFAQRLQEMKLQNLTASIEKKEDDIRSAQESPSAISIIEAAKPSEKAAVDWLPSYPLIQPGTLPAPANLSTLQASFKRGEDVVQRTVDPSSSYSSSCC
jgi:hypothetical protein